MRASIGRRILCLWVAATTASGGCRSPVPSRPAGAAGAAGGPVAIAIPDGGSAPGGRATVPLAATSEATLELSTTSTPARGTPAAISELNAGETAALLARLEPLPALGNPTATPALRPATPAPVPAGRITPLAFAAPAGKTVPDGGAASPRAAMAPAPLAPPQITPAGDIYSEGSVRIRFSDAMVPVGAIAAIAKAPATITPAVAGSWRWIDTRVAELTPTTRFAQATRYTVTVPAGTRALSGATLATAATQTFTTSGPRIAQVWPPAHLRPDSAIAITLDQRIDPAAVLPFLRVADPRGRGRSYALRAATAAEAEATWAKNPALTASRAHAAPALAANTVFVVPATAWPADTALEVQLAAGAPSLEGPVRSIATARTVQIVPAFAALGLLCDDQEAPRPTARCSARSVASVQFTNPILETSYRAALVQLEGRPFADHAMHASVVSLDVPDAVGSAFAVRIGDGLVDQYGQPLTGPRRFRFTVTKLRYSPELSAPAGLLVLDPRFEIPQWLVSARALGALRVQLYAVEPADYFAYQAFEAGERATPPGKRVYDETYEVGRTYEATLRVDLRPALARAGTGHVVAIATATRARGGEPLPDHVVRAWIQVTHLGITARTDREAANAWVHDLAPAKFLAPVAGAETSIVTAGGVSSPVTVTDAEGHSAFALPAGAATQLRGEADDALLLARAGADSTFRPLYGVERATRTHDARWYVTDDRFLYKPGETVYVKGWIRWTHSGPNPALTAPRAGTAVSYTLTDTRGTQLASGTATTGADGGFDAEVVIPPTANLGTARFAFGSTHGGARASTSHPIRIEEFRTPAYSVSLNDDVTHAGATPLVAGEAIEMAVEAKYYSGGGLPGATVEWSARLASTWYRPPGWDRYDFSPVPRPDRTPPDAVRTVTRSTTLSSASSATATLAVAATSEGRPAVLTVDTTVHDVDRMAIRASSRPILVHPSALYIGLRRKPGPDAAVEVIVTDIDGRPRAGVPVEVVLTGVLGSESGRTDAAVVDSQSCRLTSAATPVPCAYRPKTDSLAYRAVASAQDSRGRAAATRLDLPWWSRPDPKRELVLASDKPSYKPGETATISIHSATVPARALVTFARQGVFAQRSIALAQPVTEIALPIEAGFVPQLHVLVDRLSRQPGPQSTVPAGHPAAAPFAAHVSAQLEVPVDLDGVMLDVVARAVTPLVEPGAPATFEVTVKRGDAPAANAEVALIVVDEAVLSLSGESHLHPVVALYRELPAGAAGHSTLGLLDDAGLALAGAPGFTRVIIDPDAAQGGGGTGYGSLGAGAYGTIGHGMGGGGGAGVVVSRKDFRPTAVFSPRLRTDAAGKVRLTVTMPDSLTRFRVIALAATDTYYFGKGEHAIVTQRKLNARTVAPRFLSQGDRFSLPVVVQNLDREPRTVEVAARAANLRAIGPSGKRVTLGGGQRVEVRFDFATQTRGRAAVQTIATSGAFADASTIEIPVWEPATTESFATYGVVDDKPAFERLAVPAAIYPDVGGVEVEVAATQLQSLLDSIYYLQAYPYECAEQRSSRMLATAVTSDILDAFAAPGRPTAAQRAQQRTADARALQRTQNRDGGWGYFGTMESDPYVTMQVLAALAAQRDQSPTTAAATRFVQARATALLAELEAAARLAPDRRTDTGSFPARVGLAAAALEALAATGARQGPRAVRLDTAARALAVYPIDARARVLALLSAERTGAPQRAKLVTELVNASHETAAAATVTTTYVEAERWLLMSAVKTTALALGALIREVPQHPLIPKLARGVLEQRRRGHWGSTQENLVALTAMRRYFDAYEANAPRYTGSVWLGTGAYAEHVVTGRTLERATATAGWTTLAPGSQHDVAFAKTGTGRMYYRLGVTYAPQSANLPALDAGFVVQRRYQAIDDPADVTTAADGAVTIRLGARVLVTVTATALSPRYGVAVVDPVPAGLEPVNENLATAERTASAAASDWDHRNTRDNRVEAFRMQLPPGTHTLAYTARATTPGTFFAAPAKAEEMYAPETFGRSAGRTVVIE